MPIVKYAEREFEVDEDGFLQEPDMWNEDVAQFFARTENITELTEEHWKVIEFIRNYYLEFSLAPMIRLLVKKTGFTLKHIYELFPSGPAMGACKLAGIPKPTGCV